MEKRILEEIGEFIFVRDQLEQADAIFIPGGSLPDLGEEAARLWHQGLAPLIVPSGKFSAKWGRFMGLKSKRELYPGDYLTECAFLTDVLIKNGVLPQAILGEDQAGYTKQNAQFTRLLLERRGHCIRRAILCCKSFHARRVLTAYQLFFPDTRFMVHPVPAREHGVLLTQENWFQSPEGISRVLGELKRLGEQFHGEMTAFALLSHEAPDSKETT